MNEEFRLAFTYDDVTIIPAGSDVIPRDVDVSSQLTNQIRLNVPILSAAMDTVTESRLAIAMAQQGGIGIIHKNLGIGEQAREVDLVKRYQSGVIADPITISPMQSLKDARDLMKKYGISGLPVTEDGSKEGKLVGILTNRDLRFETNFEQLISEIMTSEALITAAVGTDLNTAQEILHKGKIEKLLVVDDCNKLRGLITVKDIQKAVQNPHASKDSRGRLLAGAAIGTTKDTIQRAEALVAAGCDVLVVDTAHGHSQTALDVVTMVRNKFPGVALIAGNVATAEATKALIDRGVNAVKVGIGAGSICTTRIVAGIGVPMITSIMDCAQAANNQVPVIADGGIRSSGDVTKALALGASTVMLGNLLAGTEESPGERIVHSGSTYKEYRGMGSMAAMLGGSKDRYFQDEFDLVGEKLVPEGIEGQVPYKGSVHQVLHQLIGGLRAGMGYCGCRTILALQRDTKMLIVTPAGVREGHVHDVFITKEAPNYKV